MDKTMLISDEQIKVVDGRVPRATIAYSCDGLNIYALGSSKYHHEDAVRHMALTICQSVNISVRKLRDRRVVVKPGKPLYSETVDMFGKKR